MNTTMKTSCIRYAKRSMKPFHITIVCNSALLNWSATVVPASAQPRPHVIAIATRYMPIRNHQIPNCSAQPISVTPRAATASARAFSAADADAIELPEDLRSSGSGTRSPISGPLSAVSARASWTSGEPVASPAASDCGALAGGSLASLQAVRPETRTRAEAASRICFMGINLGSKISIIHRGKHWAVCDL